MANSSDERDLRDANFVFFGGSTGIGRATAIEIGRRGGSVLIVGRGAEAGAKAVADIGAAGAKAADFLQADLSTIQGMKAAADGVRAWRPALHGTVHTAMAGFSGKQMTVDGLEFAFALQYFARAVLNRLLADALAASGDGRVVHLAGDMPKTAKPNIDDANFEHTKWSFFASIINTHLLGYLHVQEATKLWADRPITIALSCVGSTKTKAMSDPKMPFIMRALGVFGTTPEISARNTVRLLTKSSAVEAKGAILRNPKSYAPTPVAMNEADAALLWAKDAELARAKGLSLP